MQVELAVRNSEKAARMVKAKIEKTVLGQVAAHIKAVLQPTAGFVSICLDLNAINRLQLIINPRSVALALLKHSKLKLKADMIRYQPVSICSYGSAVGIGAGDVPESCHQQGANARLLIPHSQHWRLCCL